ncbi:MAG: AbrB/MazE/SpoVT family DNA-binding domain-containing protein [Candidatus Nitrosocosmicus sp.]
MSNNKNAIHYRRVQALVGEKSFLISLPKLYAFDLGIGKGDNVKVSLDGSRIIIEKAE